MNEIDRTVSGKDAGKETNGGRNGAGGWKASASEAESRWTRDALSPEGVSQERVFVEIKTRIHRQLLERLNLSNLSDRNREEGIAETRKIVQGLLAAEETPLNLDERNELVEEVLNEVFGFGPLEPLLLDETISDILVNGHDRVFVERDGRLERTDVRFRDDQHLMQVIDRIVSAIGRRIDESSPMVDARLPDGSRVNAIIPPLAVDGPHMSIRKFRRDVLSSRDLIRNGTLTEEMWEFLQGCVKSKLNVLVSGGTGSGKTTFLNALSEHIPASERIVTIEDSAELQLRQPHVVRLETRPPNLEGVGEVGQRQLLVNALRMRPDRIILGEVRGAEAVDMLQAMNTGHDGSITTLHANSPRDALSRLETLASMANLNLPERAVRQQISSAITVLVHLSRLSDGKRKVISVAEITGMEADVISLQDLFTFRREGVAEDGAVLGEFQATGIRPRCVERLEAHGVNLAPTLFANADYGRLAGRVR